MFKGIVKNPYWLKPEQIVQKFGPLSILKKQHQYK